MLVIRYDGFPLDSSAGSTGQRPEIPLARGWPWTSSIVFTNECEQEYPNTTSISKACLLRELKRGQPIAEFVQLLLDCGLGLNILKKRELADFLSMLDARGNGITDVQMFLQFLYINTHLQDGAEQKLVEYSTNSKDINLSKNITCFNKEETE